MKLLVLHFECAFNNSACITLCGIFTLIVKLFASRNRNSNLHALSLKIHIKGDNGKSFLLYCSKELHYLSFVHQYFFGTKRVAVKYIALFIRRDVHPVDKHFSVFIYFAVAFLEVNPAHTHRLYLCAEKLNACLVFFFYEELVMSASVLSESFYHFFFCHQAFLLPEV